ncbi:MAG: hypothetical protein RLZZ127_1061 [Planctomycetota bacterium]|jgi:prepilin-type N-terminal cleavage/methylation domain-containing protein
MTMSIRQAFTLIEILIVMVVIIALSGLVFASTRDLLYQMKVQKTAGAIVAAISQGQQVTVARGLAHSLHFNNSLDPFDPRWNVTGAGAVWPGIPASVHPLWPYQTNDFLRDRRWGSALAWGVVRNNAGLFAATSSPNFPTQFPVDLGVDPVTGNPRAADGGTWSNWTTDPKAQWMVLMAPWRDASGTWAQAKGGFPVWKQGGNWNSDNIINVDANNRPIAVTTKGHAAGGIFGWRPDQAGQLPAGAFVNATRLTIDGPPAGPGGPAITSPHIGWDPYGVQLGPRRFFETGTRLMIPQDYPEWRRWTEGGQQETGKSYPIASAQIGFLAVQTPWLFGGTDPFGTGWSYTSSVPAHTLNFFPSGRTSLNHCDPAAEPGRPSHAFRTRLIGVATTRTETEAVPNRRSGEPVDYQRPRALLFVSVRDFGEVVVDVRPHFAN